MSGAGAFALGLAGGYADQRDQIAKQAKRDALDAMMRQSLEGYGAMRPPGTNSATADEGGLGTRPSPQGDGTLRGYVDATEGAGNYSTLYGHAQREGGPFAGVDVSKMTIGQLKAFSDPSGPYGRYVADNNGGTVSTPMGRYQIIGTTLRAGQEGLGLSDDTVFDQATQDRYFDYLAGRRLSAGDTMAEKIAGLRNEWDGFKHVSDADLAAAILRQERTGALPADTLGIRRPI